MSSKKSFDLFKTLSFRLTLLYAGLFALSTMIAFGSIYLMTVKILNQDTDADLLEDATEFASILEQHGFEALVDEVYWEAKTDGQDSVFFRLFDRDGRGLLTTSNSGLYSAAPPCRRAGAKPGSS